MKTQFVDQDPLSKIFLALSHPIRRQMLMNLKSGKASVTELSSPFNISLPAITRHIHVLEESGLVQKTKNAQMRFIELDSAPLAEILDWIGGYVGMWSDSFEALEKFLNKSLDTNLDGKLNKK